MSQKPISTDRTVQVFTIIDTASNGASHSSVPQLDRPKCSAISLEHVTSHRLYSVGTSLLSSGWNWPESDTDNSASSAEVTHK